MKRTKFYIGRDLTKITDLLVQSEIVIALGLKEALSDTRYGIVDPMGVARFLSVILADIADMEEAVMTSDEAGE